MWNIGKIKKNVKKYLYINTDKSEAECVISVDWTGKQHHELSIHCALSMLIPANHEERPYSVFKSAHWKKRNNQQGLLGIILKKGGNKAEEFCEFKWIQELNSFPRCKIGYQYKEVLNARNNK